MANLSGSISPLINQPWLRTPLEHGCALVGCTSAWESWLSSRVMDPTHLEGISRDGIQLVQVVGTPRSGSTLLATMLDSHSQAVCLIEPYLAWLSQGEFEYDWPQLEVPGAERFARQNPRRLLSLLCREGGVKVVGFKETFRTSFHTTFPSQSFLEGNQAAGTVDNTLAIVRDPRDTWGSVIRRHPRFRGDTPRMVQVIHAWNELCEWIRREGLPMVKYEELVSEPRRVDPLFEAIGLSVESSVYQPDGTSGYGDARAQEGGKIDNRSIGKYKETLSDDVTRFIAAQCSEYMDRFGYT